MENIKSRKLLISILLIMIIAFSTCYDSFSTSFFHELKQITQDNGSIDAKESDNVSITKAIITESLKIRAGIDSKLADNYTFIDRVEVKSVFLFMYAILFKIALFHSFTFFVLIEIISIIFLMARIIIYFVHNKDGKKSNMVCIYA